MGNTFERGRRVRESNYAGDKRKPKAEPIAGRCGLTARAMVSELKQILHNEPELKNIRQAKPGGSADRHGQSRRGEFHSLT